MFLVKLGGSVATVKGRYRFYREKAVTEIFRELLKTGEQFALVHGGGSFGHIMAKEYNLPGSINDRSRLGYCIVHRDMVDLNQRVVSTMIRSGLNGIGVPPAVFPDAIEKLVEVSLRYTGLGFYPVSFGDVYLDDTRKTFSIISGDDLVLELARKLKPDRVFFLTDVDGIYNRNPKKSRGAVLLKTLEESAVYEMHGTDVTGGMGKKASAIRDITKTGTTVYVLNGNKPRRIHDAGTERFIGTVIG